MTLTPSRKSRKNTFSRMHTMTALAVSDRPLKKYRYSQHRVIKRIHQIKQENIIKTIFFIIKKRASSRCPRPYFPNAIQMERHPVEPLPPQSPLSRQAFTFYNTFLFWSRGGPPLTTMPMISHTDSNVRHMMNQASVYLGHICPITFPICRE